MLIVFIIILLIAGYSFRIVVEEAGLKDAIFVAISGILLGAAITFVIVKILVELRVI